MSRTFGILALIVGVFSYGNSRLVPGDHRLVPEKDHLVLQEANIGLQEQDMALQEPAFPDFEVSVQNGNISPQELHFVLKAASEIWSVNYGTLRSAYNHGTLQIFILRKNGHRAYDVMYQGNEICVLSDV
jgi:hypothetical protein